MEQEVKNKPVSTQDNKEKKPTWKKVLGIVFNVLFYLIIAIVLIFAIITLTKKTAKDLPHVFGKGYAIVQSDSMEPTFSMSELIIVDILDDEEKQKLQIGDVITFFDTNINHLNTHRVIGVDYDGKGLITALRTKGDNASGEDTVHANIADVKAVWPEKVKTCTIDGVKYTFSYNDKGELTGDILNVVKGSIESGSTWLSGTIKFETTTYSSRHSKSLGSIVGFITNTDKPIGFILCIIVPTILFLVYAVIVFVKNLLVYKLSKVPATPAPEVTADDKDRIIKEYLAAQEKAKEANKEEPKE